MGNCYLKSIESQFCKMKTFWRLLHNNVNTELEEEEIKIISGSQYLKCSLSLPNIKKV